MRTAYRFLLSVCMPAAFLLAPCTKTWNGWHYYYCLHDGESDWIGPINDTDFYECWIYWFKPQGNSITFW